jgi:hypothetical protein
MKKLIITLLLPILSFASISIEFSQETSALESGEIVISMTNTSDKAINVLKWNTPLEKRLKANIFRVKSGETIHRYSGRLVKRSIPQDKDYIRFDAGEIKQVHIQLSTYYKMETKGEYSIEFNGEFKYRTLSAKKSRSIQQSTYPTTSIVISYTPRAKKKLRLKLNSLLNLQDVPKMKQHS